MIGDARLLHSAHVERHAPAPYRRHAVVFCRPGRISPSACTRSTRSRNAREGRPAGWSDAGWRALRGVLAWYDGPMEPGEASRIPDARLAWRPDP